jgi:demethylmenaquinone methyltransferase/2-methoxy-6-polyprenyl-1,4-benzoquinol methylase
MSNAEAQREAAGPSDEIETYYADPVRRQDAARELFNRFAQHYDLINRIFSLGSGAWYRRRCLREAGVGPGAVVVDVGVGTGLLAREAQRLMQGRGLLVGIDLSESMLARARKSLGIPLIHGAAEALPLANGIADFVTMGYALRHLSDIERALREARRLLRPGGKLVLLEIRMPSSPALRSVLVVAAGRLLPALSGMMARNREAKALMDHHWRTVATYVPPHAVLAMMRQVGFRSVLCTSHFDFFRFYLGTA